MTYQGDANNLLAGPLRITPQELTDMTRAVVGKTPAQARLTVSGMLAKAAGAAPAVPQPPVITKVIKPKPQPPVSPTGLEPESKPQRSPWAVHGHRYSWRDEE